MARALNLHPDALREIREARDFYNLERAGLGDEFVDEIERVMALIVANPESSPVVLKGIRKRVVSRFRYSVIYSARDGDVYVSALACHSRRPFYWQGRI